ncbi:MAG TPA: hypothetical protein VLF67_03205 [Candidatus Saccharimonas sp.]|nr:hypothetical protein [Candidatus Saccharimonas sp.]
MPVTKPLLEQRILIGAGILLLLSLVSTPAHFGVLLFGDLRSYVAIVSIFTGAFTYGLCSLIGRILPLAAKRALAAVALVVLGLTALLLAPAQLSALGLAASNRNPDYAAALLGLLGAALAGWQMYQIIRRQELSKMLTVSLLAALAVYLALASL